MKLNSARIPAIIIITSLAIVIVSLMVAVIFLCLQPGVNCRSLASPKNRIGEDMRKMEPTFESKSFDKVSGNKNDTNQCSGTKREVFVDGRRLYWGNLGELTKPESFFAPRCSIQTAATENSLSQKSEALQQFTQELRAALKAFEKRYCLKINWRKKDPRVPDVTTQFINFWDSDFGRMQDTQQTSQEEKTARGGEEK